MIAGVEGGGLSFPDVESILKSQHIMWIKRYIHSTPHQWKHIFEWQMEKIGGTYALYNTTMNWDHLKYFKLMPFYENIIATW